VGEAQLHSILHDVLHGEEEGEEEVKSKKQKSHKRAAKGIPENPNHSKKALLAKEIKDVNDEFTREKEESSRRFETVKREQDLRHIQEMTRLQDERNRADRRFEAEMESRREERILAERKFEADSARHSHAMTMQMNFFAALLGGRGIPSNVPLSSDVALNHQPNTRRTP
jgi:hypothetical protein